MHMPKGFPCPARKPHAPLREGGAASAAGGVLRTAVASTPAPRDKSFPTIGNIFSIHWKTAEKFFQSLEKSAEVFQPLEKNLPIIGKLFPARPVPEVS